MTSTSLDISGPIAPDSRRVLDEFGAVLLTHPWGGDTADVLFIGDLGQILEREMPPARYAQWKAGYTQGRIAITGAISFVTRDDKRAAAVPELEDQGAFLMLAAHELVEAALDRRHTAEGHIFKEQTHTSLAHVLWSEYVVERTRRQIFGTLGVGYGPLDNGYLTADLDDAAAELPDLLRWAVKHDSVPQRLYQRWYELARVYAMSRGRADEGSPADLADLEATQGHWLYGEARKGWDALTYALREAFAQPERLAADLDQAVREEGWLPLYESLGSIWNPRYAAALGH